MEKVFDWTAPIITAATSMLENFLEFLPRLAGALVILLVGWLIARLLRGLTIKVTGGVDRFAGFLGLGKFFAAGRASEAATRTLGNVVFWVVILFFLTSATNLLGLTMFAGWLDRLVAHLPNVLSGGLIIFAGLVFGNLANEAAQTAAQNMPPRQRVLLGCQRRSKIRPSGRSKIRPPYVMRGSVFPVIPVVHRRDPRCFV
ncbi:MAG: hypothetical protein O2960_30585 [Verrucomicrobia bacterium]|nr:hypothetical protein [Verrucomicrobiota bacterium]